MPPSPPDPGKMGKALMLTQVGMEMVVPALIGLGIDYGLGSAPWCLIIGALLGFGGGLVHLVALTRPKDGPPNEGGPP